MYQPGVVAARASSTGGSKVPTEPSSTRLAKPPQPPLVRSSLLQAAVGDERYAGGFVCGIGGLAMR